MIVGTLFESLRGSLAALVFAGAAVGLAWVWLEVSAAAAIAAVAVGVVTGAVAYLVGRRALSGDRPRPLAALKWLWWTILIFGSLAAGAGMAIILLGIEWAPQKGWSDEEKALVAAGATAVTTYLTTVFVKGADEADSGWIGTVVKREFQRRFKDTFDTGSAAQRAVFSETQFVGWGRAARKQRAQVIEEAL